MFCTKCGQQLPENSRFCQNCGNQVSQIQNGTSDSQHGQPISIKMPSFVKIELKGKSLVYLGLMIASALVLLFVPILVGRNSSDYIYYIGRNEWPSKLDGLVGTEVIFFILMMTALILLAYTFLADRKKQSMILSIAYCVLNWMYMMILLTSLSSNYNPDETSLSIVNPPLNWGITIALMVMAIVAFNKSKKQGNQINQGWVFK